MAVKNAWRPAKKKLAITPNFLWTIMSQRSEGKMRIRATRSLATLAVLLLAVPVFAAKNAPGTKSTVFSVHEPTTIGQTQLKPGDYTLQAVDGQNEVDILQHGKMIGKATCHWIQLPAKSQTSQVLTDSGKVTQINFEGDLQAAQLD
jgi:hypothetical protein